MKSSQSEPISKTSRLARTSLRPLSYDELADAWAEAGNLLTVWIDEIKARFAGRLGLSRDVETQYLNAIGDLLVETWENDLDGLVQHWREEDLLPVTREEAIRGFVDSAVCIFGNPPDEIAELLCVSGADTDAERQRFLDFVRKASGTITSIAESEVDFCRWVASVQATSK